MENSSKYLADKKFIEWVFNPDEDLDEWWKSFEADNPQEKENIRQAKIIINSLRTKNKELSENEKIVLFSQILRQVEEKQQSGKRIRHFKTFLKYAAVAFLFFMIGALVFYRQDKFSPQFYSQQVAEPNAGDEARLIRPNGQKITLEEKKSIIEYTQNGQLLVNNDVIGTSIPSDKKVPELNQLVIPYGKTSEIFLSDGTKVYLNAGSRLVYPEFFVDKNREVFLVGEAFFEVKHDEKHPFIVQTTDLRVKVLGTQFNLSAYPSENIIETVLTQGRVRLEQNNSRLFDESTLLLPGQLGAFDKTTRETQLENVDTENYVLWKDGIFKFESSDLSRVIKRLERFYNLTFHYEDPLLGMIKISGKLEFSNNKSETLNRVATVASVNIEQKGENYYVISE